MKVLLTENNIVFDLGNDIVYAKAGGENGGLMPCEEAEATHIWNREKNLACMAHSDITMIEVENVPEEVEIAKYKYENESFVINEDYVEYHSDEERIAALEDMVNMLLLGGQN